MDAAKPIGITGPEVHQMQQRPTGAELSKMRQVQIVNDITTVRAEITAALTGLGTKLDVRA